MPPVWESRPFAKSKGLSCEVLSFEAACDPTGRGALVGSCTAAPQTKVPTEVSLLDYAGFRYDADLKSRPIIRSR